MNTKNIFGYAGLLGMVVMLGSCSFNHYSSSGGEDDVYGGTSASQRMEDRYNQDYVDNGNPDYEGNYDPAADGQAYYDEEYMSVRNYRRQATSDVYNDGFIDGLNAGSRNAFNPFWGGMSPWMGSWGPSISLGFSFGWNRWGGFGMNPWGWNRFNAWNMYDPFWNSYAFGGPWGGYGGWGNPYGMGYYGGGWPVYRPGAIIVNNENGGVHGRTYGPRRGVAPVVRSSRGAAGTAARSNNTSAVSRNNRSIGTNGSEAYRATTRSNSRSSVGARSGNRRNIDGGNSGSYYYSQPRSNSRSNSTPSSGSTYRRQSGSEGSSGYRSSGRSSYQAPSRSYNNSRSYDSAPSRNNYSAPSRSNNSAPSRSNNSFSSPSRSSGGSSSAPSGGGSSSTPRGGGSSRGPR